MVTDEISLADFIGKYYSGEGLRLGQSMPHGGVQWNWGACDLARGS
jgi:hypothetical protein